MAAKKKTAKKKPAPKKAPLTFDEQSVLDDIDIILKQLHPFSATYPRAKAVERELKILYQAVKARRTRLPLKAESRLLLQTEETYKRHIFEAHKQVHNALGSLLNAVRNARPNAPKEPVALKQEFVEVEVKETPKPVPKARGKFDDDIMGLDEKR